MDFRPIRILLIEDNPGDARLINEYLRDVRGARFEVEHVDQLTNALERLAKAKFHVVMSDLTLPDSSGIATFLNVQAQAPDTPIILLTGLDDEELALNAVQEGAQDYLVKGQIDANIVGRSIRYAIERKRIEEQLLHHALHDVLTGLPNRAVLLDRIERGLKRTLRRSDYRFAIMFLDLDGFKSVNDKLGHVFGDQMLKTTAKRLESCLRPGDTVARYGGDEFAVLVDDVGDIGAVTTIAERVQKELAKPFNLNGREVHTSASVGIAMVSHEYERPEEMVRDADTAMYRAKGRGAGRYEVFHVRRRPDEMQILHMEKNLRHAIDRDEMHLDYQPIIDLRTGHVTSFEALVRWKHPQGYRVYPSVFIPVAERNQIIETIGEWVMRTALKKIREWRDLGHPDLCVSVNLSARQIHQRNLMEIVESALKDAGVPGSVLEFEITESTAAQNAELAAQVLGEMRALGIRVAIDDFGTGYSSLSHLRRFPVDTLKIDQSFVKNLPDDTEDRTIAKSIIALGHSLELRVLAEGVETKEQLEFLVKEHCDEIQGHYIAAAMPPQDVLAFLEGRGGNSAGAKRIALAEIS
ncbi:EAL domain-containing protein [bacterium]|nr:EAL domain-containing protein [bacterium]